VFLEKLRGFLIKQYSPQSGILCNAGCAAQGFLIPSMSEGADDGSRLAFSWAPVVKKYQRDRSKDKRRLISDD
ncbi:TPA: hypothetical protein ACHJUC_003854, partial [Escherichia coli]